MEIPDPMLVQRAQGGDVGAFEALVERYERNIYNLAFRLMGNHTDAADAAQESLVKLYLRLRHFRGDAAFSTWLYRIVTNACLDQIRRRRRESHPSLDEPHPSGDGHLERQFSANQDGPAELAERRQIQSGVQKAISQLRDDYRALVVLRDIQGLSYQEIGEVTGLSAGTLKSRLHRSRRALRRIMEGDRCLQEFVRKTPGTAARRAV